MVRSIRHNVFECFQIVDWPECVGHSCMLSPHPFKLSSRITRPKSSSPASCGTEVLRLLNSAMLAWMGGKRSKLKHAKKHHVSKPGQNRTTTANAGSKRPVASPASRTRARPAKRPKADLHMRAGDRGKEVVSTAEQGQAPVSSDSSDLERFAASTSMMDEQEDNDDHSHLQGDANASCSTRTEQLPKSLGHSCKAANQELQSKCTRGPKEERTAAVSLDLQAIQLPG